MKKKAALDWAMVMKRFQDHVEHERKRDDPSKVTWEQVWERFKVWREEGWTPIPCVICGKVFPPDRSNAKYCSSACKMAGYRKAKEKAK